MINPARTVARLLISSTFVALGFDALRTPGGRVAMAGPTLATIRKRVPLPDNDEHVVRANAAVMVVAGSTFGLGRLPRLSAVALAGSLVPTTVAGHAFWTVEDPTARKLQRVQFQKNAAMLGGLLLAAVDRPA